MIEKVLCSYRNERLHSNYESNKKWQKKFNEKSSVILQFPCASGMINIQIKTFSFCEDKKNHDEEHKTNKLSEHYALG